MKEAGTIAAAAMQAAIEVAQPGTRQCDVITELNKFTTAGTPAIGGTFTRKPPNAMVGKYCSAPNLSSTDAVLKRDEMFYIEMGGCRHRYHAPLSRCIFLGRPSAALSDLVKVFAEGLEVVLYKAQPGTLYEDFEAA